MTELCQIDLGGGSLLILEQGVYNKFNHITYFFQYKASRYICTQ